MNHLIGFAFATVARAKYLECFAVTNLRERIPKGNRDASVVGVLDDFSEFAIFYEAGIFAAKLKLVTVVVDRPGNIGFHVNPTFDRSKHVGQRAGAGFQIDVGYAINRGTVPASRTEIGDAGKPQTRLAFQAAEAA